jgi:hypothetical protein
MCPVNAPTALIADNPCDPNFRTKPSNEINGLQGLKNKLEKSSLFWVKVNDVTWKLSDGEMSRTPASFGKWAGYNTERALAWVIEVGWPFGRSAWHARCGDKCFGPTDFNKARQASRALVNGAQGSFTGLIDLNLPPPAEEWA